MPNTPSLELRERAFRAYEGGEGSYTEVATTFAISRRSLQRWVERRRTTGESAAWANGGGPPVAGAVGPLTRRDGRGPRRHDRRLDAGGQPPGGGLGARPSIPTPA